MVLMRFTSVILIVAINFSVLDQALADTHCVTMTNALASPPYTNWLTAATNIQDAINKSSPLDIVSVASGTYWLSNSISITNAITLLSMEGRSNTVVNGRDLCCCLKLNSADAVVNGFTFTHGNSPTGGGGLLSSIGGTVRNCTFVSNAAHSVTLFYESGGGGIYLAKGGLIDNCRIVSNVVYSSQHTADIAGVGAYLHNGGQLTNCDVSYNCATSDTERIYGGGVFLRNGGELRDCRIVGNTAKAYGGHGGGVYSMSGGTFDGCTIRSNEVASSSGAGANGAGLCLISGGTLRHCTIRRTQGVSP